MICNIILSEAVWRPGRSRGRSISLKEGGRAKLERDEIYLNRFLRFWLFKILSF
jgi:hypothetical protein